MHLNHQPPGSGRAPQRFQDALLLLRRFLRELGLLRAGGRREVFTAAPSCSTRWISSCRLFSWSSRTEGRIKMAPWGYAVGQQAAGALQDRAQTLARTDAVYAGILDFSLHGDGRTQIFPPGQLRHAENVTVFEGNVPAGITRQQYTN